MIQSTLPQSYLQHKPIFSDSMALSGCVKVIFPEFAEWWSDFRPLTSNKCTFVAAHSTILAYGGGSGYRPNCQCWLLFGRKRGFIWIRPAELSCMMTWSGVVIMFGWKNKMNHMISYAEPDPDSSKMSVNVLNIWAHWNLHFQMRAGLNWNFDYAG